MLHQPWRGPAPHELMALTLYAHPLDAPNHYALRAWYIRKTDIEPATSAILFETIADAETFVGYTSLGTAWMGRNTEPQVVRCWTVGAWRESTMELTLSDFCNLWEVTGPHFRAGLVVRTTATHPKLPAVPRVVAAAPILEWAVGQPWEWVQNYCERKHWHLQILVSEPGELPWRYNLETLEPLAAPLDPEPSEA